MAEVRIAREPIHVAELEAKVGEPFEHEAKLKTLTQRQEEIVKALDLTRNQASNRLDAAPASEGEEAVAEKVNKDIRHRLRHCHGAKAATA